MNNYKKDEMERDYELLNDIYEYLSEERGIVLLDPMSEDERNRLISKSKRYPKLKGEGILDEDDRRLYFRLVKLNHGFTSSMELQKKADKEFLSGHYTEAIDTLKTIIENYSYVNSYVYELMGLSYLKKNEEDRAVPYLILSTYISSKEDPLKSRDYSQLINLITGDIKNRSYMANNHRDKEDVFYGREFRMNEKDTFGIVNIDKIREYAAKNKVTMEEAGDAFHLTDEQKDLLKLIVAREYYGDANFKQGDLYLNTVEATRAKTDRVREVLKDIRDKKRFLQYRNEKLAERSKKPDNRDPEEKVLTYIKPGKRTYR